MTIYVVVRSVCVCVCVWDILCEQVFAQIYCAPERLVSVERARNQQFLEGTLFSVQRTDSSVVFAAAAAAAKSRHHSPLNARRFPARAVSSCRCRL